MSNVIELFPLPASEPTVIVGPRPSYSGYLHLPEEGRWKVYAAAKARRAVLESQGSVLSESYDEFVKRVSSELEI